MNLPRSHSKLWNALFLATGPVVVVLGIHAQSWYEVAIGVLMSLLLTLGVAEMERPQLFAGHKTATWRVHVALWGALVVVVFVRISQ